jgi:pyruvate carboxylase subunit A
MDMGVDGVKTTIPYYAEILKSSGFRSARFDTGYVEKHPELLNYTTGHRRHDTAAALAAVIVAHAGL